MAQSVYDVCVFWRRLQTLQNISTNIWTGKVIKRSKIKKRVVF